MHQMFDMMTRKLGLNEQGAGLSTAHFRRPGGEQMKLL